MKFQYAHCANLHNHCYLDDGQSKPGEYVDQAIRLGFSAIGFSCHAPLPFDLPWHLSHDKFRQYKKEITDLKKQYKDRVEIYLGLEIDYLEDAWGPSHPWFADLDLDYCVGSVHFVYSSANNQYLPLDGSIDELEEILSTCFDGDKKRLVADYFRLQKALLANHSFDILAHCDLIKKLNIDNWLFDRSEKWYHEAAVQVLKVCAKLNRTVEVSAAPYFKKIAKEPYPDRFLIEQCFDLNVGLALNADAHEPLQVGAYFEDVLSDVKKAGYRKLRVLSKGCWRDKAI